MFLKILFLGDKSSDSRYLVTYFVTKTSFIQGSKARQNRASDKPFF